METWDTTNDTPPHVKNAQYELYNVPFLDKEALAKVSRQEVIDPTISQVHVIIS